jgi:excisionase family DNA binding protein
VYRLGRVIIAVNFEERLACMARDDELTVEEAAERIGVTAESIRRYLRSGELRGYQLARKLGWRTTPKDIDDFLEARKRASQLGVPERKGNTDPKSEPAAAA